MHVSSSSPALWPLNLHNPPRKILRSHDGQFNKSICQRSVEVNYVYRTSKCIHEAREEIQNPCRGDGPKRGYISIQRPVSKQRCPFLHPPAHMHWGYIQKNGHGLACMKWDLQASQSPVPVCVGHRTSCKNQGTKRSI